MTIASGGKVSGIPPKKLLGDRRVLPIQSIVGDDDEVCAVYTMGPRLQELYKQLFIQ